MNLLDGNDTVTVPSDFAPAITADGADGLDNLTGGEGDDTLDGGAGDDSFTPAGGADDVVGGGGLDFVSLSAPPTNRNVTLFDNLANDGEGDNIHSDVESVSSDTGNDVIVGTDDGNNLAANGGNDNIDGRGGDDVVFGGDGNDTLEGGTGDDLLFGDDPRTDPALSGNDTINARDGELDTIDCGPGIDVVNADDNEASIDANCETINRPPPPVVNTDPPAGGGGGGGGGGDAGGAAPVTANPATTAAPVNAPASTPTVTAALKTPTGLTAKLKAGRDRSRPYSFTISGKLSLPAGVGKAAGCKGTVKLTGKRGTKTVVTKSATLKSDCSYSIKASVKSKGQVRMTVRFAGNSVLKGKNAPTRIARAG